MGSTLVQAVQWIGKNIDELEYTGFTTKCRDCGIDVKTIPMEKIDGIKSFEMVCACTIQRMRDLKHESAVNERHVEKLFSILNEDQINEILRWQGYDPEQVVKETTKIVQMCINEYE